MPESLFGVHAKSLRVGSARINQISRNIANLDTPGYKARDIDFAAAMRGSNEKGSIKRTHPDHLQGSSTATDLMYRVPLTPRPDQNTVDEDLEKAAFQEASLHYQATLEFIDGKTKNLKQAIKG